MYGQYGKNRQTAQQQNLEAFRHKAAETWMQLQKKRPMPAEQYNCLTPSLMYRGHVTTDTDTTGKFYIELTEGSFKTRYNNHTLSFRDRKRESSTELSKYIWKLKDEYTNYKIHWTVLTKAAALQQQDQALQLMPDGKTIHHQS